MKLGAESGFPQTDLMAAHRCGCPSQTGQAEFTASFNASSSITQTGAASFMSTTMLSTTIQSNLGHFSVRASITIRLSFIGAPAIPNTGGVPQFPVSCPAGGHVEPAPGGGEGGIYGGPQPLPGDHPDVPPGQGPSGSCPMAGGGGEDNHDGGYGGPTGPIPHPLPAPWYNAPGQQLIRLFPAEYADGKDAPNGTDRSNPRDVSNAVHKAEGDKPNSAGASDLFWAWGQFLDHDMSLSHGSDDKQPIDIPAGDPRFDPEGNGDASLPFSRTEAETDHCGVRQQVNSITPLIDGSNVYGSTPDEQVSLRSGVGGMLKMSEDDNLPRDENGFFLAGDARVNENPVLTGMHTVFAREHNRLADEIGKAHPSWSDQQIFDAARKINVGQMQAITQNEFLPVLLGPGGQGQYTGYTGVNPQISNEFSTSAFRFGHSLVSDQLRIVDEHGNATEIPLSQAFFNPGVVNQGGIDDVLRGAASQSAQEMDAEIVDSLRDNVIPGPAAHPLDLAAMNIQRGRDHGMPSLNDARRGLGLPPLTGFDDPRLRDGVGEKLAEVYDSIEDVDLWTGMMSERPVGAGMAGQTQAAVLADQFHRTRAGDPEWYERSFTPDQVAALNRTTLSDIIERNSPDTDIQDFAMLVPQHQVNQTPYLAGAPMHLLAANRNF